MQGQQLYEYAVIRLVPRVEREEFINIGVILFSKTARYIDTKFTEDFSRCKIFDAGVDWDEIQEYLCAFQAIAKGNHPRSPIASLIPAERFRWLTATRSTSIQCSKVHPGFCSDLPAELEKLYEVLVN
jgi:hypothetical protein